MFFLYQCVRVKYVYDSVPGARTMMNIYVRLAGGQNRPVSLSRLVWRCRVWFPPHTVHRKSRCFCVLTLRWSGLASSFSVCCLLNFFLYFCFRSICSFREILWSPCPLSIPSFLLNASRSYPSFSAIFRGVYIGPKTTTPTLRKLYFFPSRDKPIFAPPRILQCCGSEMIFSWSGSYLDLNFGSGFESGSGSGLFMKHTLEIQIILASQKSQIV